MDATEGMKKAIAERKEAIEQKVKLVRHVHLDLDSIRQRRRDEQHRTE